MTPNVATTEDTIMTNTSTESLPGNQSPPPMYDHERNNMQNENSSWNVAYAQKFNGMTSNSRIEYRTRLEPLSQKIPNSLYAPIIYQMHLTFKMTPTAPALIQQDVIDKWNELEFVIGKVRVVNGQQPHEEILKNGKPIIQGMQQIALTRQKTDGNEFIFFGHNKIQFLDCSYHHNKQSFALEWSFHLPNSMNQPILILLSTPFKVYARKPNKKRKDVGNVDADLQQEHEERELKRKRGDNEKYYEFHLTKRGQQDGGSVPVVDMVSVNTEIVHTNPRQGSPTTPSAFFPIEGQPLKKRVRLMNDVEEANGVRQANPQRERDPSPATAEMQRVSPTPAYSTNVAHNPAVVVDDENEFQERLSKLLEYVRSHKNMSCVQVVISSMMAVASDMYREAGQIN
jgi:hypothetical protein